MAKPEKENNIRVTAVIPVYPDSKPVSVKRMIKALQGQTMADFEAIFVGDSKRRETFLPVRKAKHEDDRFHFYRQHEERDPRRTGLKYAKGEWVIFLTPECILKSQAFEKMLEAGMKHKAITVIGRYHTKTEDGQRTASGECRGIPFDEAVKIAEHPQYLKRVYGSGIGIMYRTRLLEKYGIKPEIPGRCADVSFVWRALLLSKKTVRIRDSVLRLPERAEYPVNPEEPKWVLQSFSKLFAVLEKTDAPGLKRLVRNSAADMLLRLCDSPYDPEYRGEITKFLDMPVMNEMPVSRLGKILSAETDRLFDEIEKINKNRIMGLSEMTEEEYNSRNAYLQNRILNIRVIKECNKERTARAGQ